MTFDKREDVMGDIRFTCPRCKQSLEAPPDMAGEPTQCPTCQHNMTVPSPQSAQAAVPARRSRWPIILAVGVPVVVAAVLLVFFARLFLPATPPVATPAEPVAASVAEAPAPVPPPPKAPEFLGLPLRCSPKEALDIIAQGPEPCELDKQSPGDFKVMLFTGNHRLKEAQDTMLQFWKDQLFFVVVRFVPESEYQAKEKYRVLHLKLKGKYGQEDSILAIGDKSQWTDGNIVVELWNQYNLEELHHEVAACITDKQLSQAQDRADLRQKAGEMGDF